MGDLEEENRVLRERIAQLEAGADPIARALLDNAPSFSSVVDLDGRMLATGRTSEGFGSVVGRSVFEFTDPSSHDVLRDALARVRATGEAVQYEVTGYGENGEPGHVYRTRALPVREGDRVTAVLLIATDITDRVRLERSLLESQRALQLAMEASGVGLWRWDIGHDKVEWDRRLLEMWGLTETPPDYQSYLAQIHPDDRERVIANVRQAMETGVFPTFEHRLTPRPDGSTRWILSAGGTMRDDKGKITLLMGVVLDVTEQKRFESQMERAARVEAIGQLTAGLAHNFNNLLAAIIPNVEMVMGDTNERGRIGLSVALDAALQARELVRSLLALAGRRPNLVRAPADPAKVVADVLTICRTTFPREIEIKWTVDANLGSVSMPESELEQVLLNLLFNARDALEDVAGERRISVSAEHVDVDGASWVRLNVTDTGVGMPEEVRRKLGEPFFTTKPHRGSGLGLANAFARVREIGGRIECDSVPARGTTFTLHLPGTATTADVPLAPTAPIVAGQGETLLLVDDEPLVRSAVRQLLETEGYVVLEAASASEARAVLDASGDAVRLVILDQSMPAESGLAALPSIRARTRAPIVLFTGLTPHTTPSDVVVLEKPARPVEIRRVVRELLGARRPSG